MNEHIKIDIVGIKSETLDVLQHKYNNINVTYDDDKGTMQLKLSKSMHEDFVITAIDDILNSFSTIHPYELSPSWVFDESNSMVKGPDQKYVLTKKEVVFLKMLINNDKIITYTEMVRKLWKDSEEVSQNAMRLFTKNLKKKLPPKILRNFQNTGYKLIL